MNNIYITSMVQWYSGKLFPILSSMLRRSSIYLKLDGMTGGSQHCVAFLSIAGLLNC